MQTTLTASLIENQPQYQNKYKLTTHQAASFVIARRGLLSYNKSINVKDKQGNIKRKM